MFTTNAVAVKMRSGQREPVGVQERFVMLGGRGGEVGSKQQNLSRVIITAKE